MANLNTSNVLTFRERQIKNLLLQGKSNKEIARIFEISPRTVEDHRQNMLRKEGVQNVTEMLFKHFTAKIAELEAANGAR